MCLYETLYWYQSTVIGICTFYTNRTYKVWHSVANISRISYVFDYEHKFIAHFRLAIEKALLLDLNQTKFLC